MGRRACHAALTCSVFVAALGAASVSVTAADGGRYVVETFTGSTTTAGFVGYGSACLTGAPAGQPGPGEHALGGCPAARVGPVPPTGAAPHGFLQLTDASTDQAGAVLFDLPIPATQGLRVTFDQWQYGTTTPTSPSQAPADGIAFLLTDGATTLDAPGAFGGSLGYAQKLPYNDPAREFIPGVDGGYLGIGLDALGNYFGDWERRSNGCPTSERSPAGGAIRRPEPDKITVRGPGQGIQGYCFLTSTSTNLDSSTGPWNTTLPFSLRNGLTSLPAGPIAAESALQAVRRTVTVTVSPAPDAQVTVEISRGDEEPQQVLSFAAPSPVPDSYKFGFSASTGLFTDVHLVRNVVVESVLPAPLLELEKRVDGSGPFQVGDLVHYLYSVTNTGLVEVDDLRVTDDRISTVTCEHTTLAPAGSTECRARYRVVAADVDERGRVVNVAVASADDGGATSPPADASIRIVAPSPSPSPTPPASPEPTSTQSQPAEAIDASDTGADSGATLPDSGLQGWVPRAAACGLALVACGLGLALLARRRKLPR